MKRLLLILAAFCTLAVTSAKAATIVLTFEGLKNHEPVLHFYNGGLGGMGSGPGPADGVEFSPNSLAIIDDDFGGDGNFTGNPSGHTILFFLSGSAATMNVAAGFDTGFSFFYSAGGGVGGSVKVWSGLNSTGTLLGTFTLAPTPTCPGEDDAYCTWIPVGVSFAGIAHSADFGGSANFIGFDDVTLGSASPGVPEPASLLLLGTGLVGIARKLRKKV